MNRKLHNSGGTAPYKWLMGQGEVRKQKLIYKAITRYSNKSIITPKIIQCVNDFISCTHTEYSLIATFPLVLIVFVTVADFTFNCLIFHNK